MALLKFVKEPEVTSSYFYNNLLQKMAKQQLNTIEQELKA